MENNNFENEVMNEAAEATEPVVEEQVDATEDQEAVVAEAEEPTEAQEIVAEEQEYATAEPESATETVLDKIKNLPKNILIAGIAVLLVVILAVSILPSVLGNTYKTPINAMYDMYNAKKYDKVLDANFEMLNGFTEKEMKQVFSILKKSEDIEEYLEDAEENFEDEVEDLKDEYGKNYKVKYKIEEKEKLEKEDLRDFRDRIRDSADSLMEIVEETEDYDSDDWEDLAHEIGLKRFEVKKLIKSFEKLAEEWKDAKVTAGYEIELTNIVTGSELDEPEEDDMTVYVYKVNGRWISQNAISFSLFGFFF